ncbi:MAG: DUF5131 family protein [Gammaproteobacteria bacterium]
MATLISWADETWNPVTGCSRVSEGCRNCYAERLSTRYGWTKRPWTAANAEANVRCRPERLGKPKTWKKPSRVFVNSMSDLFHPLIPDAFLAEVFAVMAETPQHTYQILTKRPERAASWAGPWLENIWMGTSVEDARALPRVDALRTCGALTKFISAEPLLGALDDFDAAKLDWVIVGGESGPGYRPMQQSWCRAIRDRCVEKRAAFFYKQDAGPRTEMRPWLVEEDGSCWQWRQYPGRLVSPTLIPLGSD